VRKLYCGLVLGVSGWISALPAAAQCVLCYSSASSAGNRGIQALKEGILVLLVPTLLIFAGITFLAVRHRNLHGKNDEAVLPDAAKEEAFLRQESHSSSSIF
jgi:hypothetical protein